MNIKARDFKKIVILTGAGISAESGISTFRDANGLWENHKVQEVATPEAYARDPQLVWKFYSMRRIQAAKALPNPAHRALINFAANAGSEIHLITQNVDVLHERADITGKLPPLCMHGSLNQSRCTHCETVYLDDHAYFDLDGNYAPSRTELCSAEERTRDEYLHHYKLEYAHFLPLSPCCKAPLRPHIVWFGEIPFFMAKIEKRLRECDLFVSIGTSGQVYPAAGFLQVAKSHNARTVCINKEAIPQSHMIDVFLEGKAAEIVPDFFA